MSERYYPDSLKRFPIWALWRLERDQKDRPTKVPYSPNYDGRASSTNPRTWGTFEQAVNKYKSRPDFYNGISLIISKEFGLVFIDIDHCIDDSGILNETASDIVERLREQYIEYSQSGTGIHIIARGAIPKGFKNSQNGVEMYSDKRFCSLTGLVICGRDPSEDQSGIDYVYQRYKTQDKAKKVVRSKNTALNNGDQWIVEHAMCQDRFKDLYSGEWGFLYGSQSEADLALCLILAFWTNCNEEQIDRIFRSSGLYREKWERDDYRSNTIQNAVDHCRETLQEYVERKNKERGDQLDRELCKVWDGQI